MIFRSSARLLRPTLLGSVFLLPLFSISAARADVYHAVSTGETLAGIAAKYKVSPDTLRDANKLKTPDTSPLDSMLLRVPGVDDKTGALALGGLKAAPKTSTTNAGFGGTTFSAPMTGTIGKSVPETVRAGDSYESIAARYTQAGHEVSADAIRRKNGANLPTVGQKILVPLGQITYSAPLAPSISPTAVSFPNPTITASAQSAPRTLEGGATVSDEMELPLAKSLPVQTPVYKAVNAPKPVVRGPLASRGGFGQMTRQNLGDGVRILGQGEEAAAPPAPAARVASAKPTTLARVAKVASAGARIRRLPQSKAASLYNCAVGTQLAVLKTNGIWSAVLMSDRSTGWVPTKYLQTTSQTVDVSSQIVTSQGAGGSASYKGYNGENPMVSAALKWLGTRYRYGGTSRNGIDCSALVQNSFKSCGYNLPRTAAQQATVGTAIEPANLHSGDRLYFSASGTRIDHTGLYMGNGLFVHASGSGRQVMVSNLYEPRNWNIFVGARR